jgi:homoaconitase/3-isopropylmalate dehydratase large subunit
MGTIGEEIFSLKLGRKIHAGEIVLVAMDFTMSHDATPPLHVPQRLGNVSLRSWPSCPILLDHFYSSPIAVSESSSGNVSQERKT